MDNSRLKTDGSQESILTECRLPRLVWSNTTRIHLWSRSLWMEVPLYRISLFYDRQHPCWYSGRWHSVSCNNVSVQHFQGQKAKVRLWMVCVINHSFAWAKHKQSSVAAGLRLECTSSLVSWVLAKAAGRGWSSNPSPLPIRGLDTVEDSVLSHQNATESEKVESPHVAVTERIRQTPVVQSQCSVGASCWIIKLWTARASRLGRMWHGGDEGETNGGFII